MDKNKLLDNLELIKKVIEECIQLITSRSKLKPTGKREIIKSAAPGVLKLRFDMPIRPFVKIFSKSMSGPKKFTLLVAYLANGDGKKTIKLSEIEKQWNKMTRLLGGKFNRFYSQQAKDNDWVESKSKGTYNLRPSWSKALAL